MATLLLGCQNKPSIDMRFCNCCTSTEVRIASPSPKAYSKNTIKVKSMCSAVCTRIITRCDFCTACKKICTKNSEPTWNADDSCVSANREIKRKWKICLST